jgi:penicillin amidase
VSANQKITPPGYRHHLSVEWQPPYRARRIDELLLNTALHDSASFAHMQIDTVSLGVREVLPHLLSTKPKNQRAREALKMLATWDGNMAAGRPEPLIVTGWWRELARAVLGRARRGFSRKLESARPVPRKRPLREECRMVCGRPHPA